MKEKVLILNGVKYVDKKTGDSKAMLNVIFMNDESIADNKNFFGSQAIVISIDAEKFEIVRQLKMQVVQAEIDFVNNSRNPLRPKTVVKSFKTQDGKVFNLA